jgi:hypothetical protein
VGKPEKIEMGEMGEMGKLGENFTLLTTDN